MRAQVAPAFTFAVWTLLFSESIGAPADRLRAGGQSLPGGVQAGLPRAGHPDGIAEQRLLAVGAEEHPVTQQHKRPPYRFRFETGIATHVGKVRRANEDSGVALGDLGVWAVADGMGGHAGGQFASRTLTKDIASAGLAVSAADQVAQFKDRVMRGNHTIRQHAEAKGGGTVGTTLAAMLAFDHGYSCVWAGDSRVYLLRDGVLSQVTKDHTEAQELVDSGVLTREEAKTWPRRNVITRAVGIFEDPELEERTGEIKPADTFVLCSDGLTGHMSDEEIAALTWRLRPQQACDALIAATLERGATDNVTVIVVRCHATEPTVALDIPGARPVQPS